MGSRIELRFDNLLISIISISPILTQMLVPIPADGDVRHTLKLRYRNLINFALIIRTRS